jgi:hypothetical protein
MSPNLDGILGLAACSILLLPFAIWKWIDILIWIFENISISWG